VRICVCAALAKGSFAEPGEVVPALPPSSVCAATVVRDRQVAEAVLGLRSDAKGRYFLRSPGVAILLSLDGLSLDTLSLDTLSLNTLTLDTFSQTLNQECVVNCWFAMQCLSGFLLMLCLVSDAGAIEETFELPPGAVIEEVAGADVVEFPMFACFDDAGRLYVAEGSGQNISGEELEKTLPCKIALLEDTNADGKFDKRTVYADQLIFPAGVLWHGGKVYVASPPGIWVFADEDGDGRADSRELLVTGFAHDGTGHDVHGPFFGPDGWLYWTDGLRDYKVPTQEGPVLEGRAALIWRCRPDGSKVEWLCGGGIDNPVELVFLPNGTLLGTMDQTPGDALLHYIDGGWYPSLHDNRVRELPNTGPQLGAVEQFSAAFPAALCGFCRLRSDYFGAEYQGALITSQFNVHRLQRHDLVPAGATWQGSTSNFAVSTNYDFHPTDVLEDADGSLILVNMGAWYNYECPNSKYARPELTGGLYRIRMTAAPPADDPWGNTFDFDRANETELIELFTDARPKVRDKAIEALVGRGEVAVAALQAAAVPQEALTESPAAGKTRRLNAVWALSRINTAAARLAVRRALLDPAADVRQAATHCVGVERDAAAFDRLAELVVSDEFAVRLKAAEALGRIGNPRATEGIRESLRTGTSDRFLEHALIYALIRLDDRPHTLPLLRDANPQVRRAGLIALDQMPHGGLERTDVAAQLDTEDPLLQQTALEVIARHEGWAEEIVSLADDWLQSDNLTEAQSRSLTGAIVAFAAEPQIQQLVQEHLAAVATPTANRLLLLRGMGRSRLPVFPQSWNALLDQQLSGENRALRAEALRMVHSRGLAEFDDALQMLVAEESAAIDERVTALAIIAPRLDPLPAAMFALLIARFADDVPPLSRLTAASAIARTRLSDVQLEALVEMVAREGPLTVPLLVEAFRRSRNENLGQTLMVALHESPGGSAVAVDVIENLLRRLPPSVRTAARPLLESRAAQQNQDEKAIARLFARVSVLPGEAARGRKVFFSKKVGCYGCHQMENQGGRVGPDLTKIGRVRRNIDLIEAIAVPSSTIVPGFRTYSVLTADGQVKSGLIVNQTADAVYLRTGDLSEIRIPRDEIEELRPSEVSLMPKGLEQTMTAQEFADLLEFLYTRR